VPIVSAASFLGFQGWPPAEGNHRGQKQEIVWGRRGKKKLGHFDTGDFV